MTRNEIRRPRADTLPLPPVVIARWGLAVAATLALAAAASAQSTSIGLSAEGAQRFVKVGLGFVPQQGDLFARALAAGDFNGDGADDLATGIPLDDSEAEDGGAVLVRFGSPRGLGGEPRFFGVEPFQTQADDGFGYSLVACDFDGNGYDDLAAGAPYRDAIASVEAAGRVFVSYHTGSFASIIAIDVFSQNTPGVPNDSEANDYFGLSLACGDFDDDGYDDLAIGSPGETLGTASFSGMLFVMPGSPDGLDSTLTLALAQGTSLPGIPEPFDFFSWALAAGDFDGDGRDDLAIGVPGEDNRVGAVQVVFGSPSGLDPLRNAVLDENVIGGLAEPDDFFGHALVAGDFDGDGRDDLAIGIPFEDFVSVGGTTDANGQVAVVYGAAGGFDVERTQFWAENNILGPGTSETNDWFGYALASGDFDRDGRDDLAIGHPNETISGIRDGAATVLMGSAAGLSADRARGIAAGLGGFPGDASEHDRWFAFSLAAGDFDGDGHGDLALGAPREDVGGLADAGTEMVLYGALFADGFETGDATLWGGAAP